MLNLCTQEEEIVVDAQGASAGSLFELQVPMEISLTDYSLYDRSHSEYTAKIEN
jgi:hypothetical protein